MTSTTSSADPQALFHYADTAAGLNDQLENESRLLGAALDRFAATCTEYNIGVGPHLADDLHACVRQIRPVDEWVRLVALLFLLADIGLFGSFGISILCILSYLEKVGIGGDRCGTSVSGSVESQGSEENVQTIISQWIRLLIFFLPLVRLGLLGPFGLEFLCVLLLLQKVSLPGDIGTTSGSDAAKPRQTEEKPRKTGPGRETAKPSKPQDQSKPESSNVDVHAMNQQQFINFVGKLARKAQKETGVPASVTIAQAILETGWGKETIEDAHNLFGIKGKGSAGSIKVPTREFLNGKWITVSDEFAKYHSFDESVIEHGNLISRKSVYKNAMKHKHNPDEFARQLEGIYATDPQYAEKLISLMKKYDLYRFDK